MAEEGYDLAVSFAGDQRDYVEQTVRAYQARGLTVFYDKDSNNHWWGQNFIREQRTIYSSKTRYFVPFISNEYLNRPIPMDEFSAAMMTAVKQGDGYVLPVLMDDSQVPADLPHPQIHYLRASSYTPEQLADEWARKVGAARDAGQQPAPIGNLVEEALQFRMPKIVPNDWSKYEELDRVFDYLIEQFTKGAQELRKRNIVCSVRQREDQIIVRVERDGETIAGLDVRRGDQMGDDHITWSTNWRTGSGNSYNGWAKPVFDKERGVPGVKVNDLSSMMQGRSEAPHDMHGLFSMLWGQVIEQVER